MGCELFMSMVASVLVILISMDIAIVTGSYMARASAVPWVSVVGARGQAKALGKQWKSLWVSKCSNVARAP